MPEHLSAKNQNIPDNLKQVINPQIRPKETSNEITKVTHIGKCQQARNNTEWNYQQAI